MLRPLKFQKIDPRSRQQKRNLRVQEKQECFIWVSFLGLISWNIAPTTWGPRSQESMFSTLSRRNEEYQVHNATIWKKKEHSFGPESWWNCKTDNQLTLQTSQAFFKKTFKNGIALRFLKHHPAPVSQSPSASRGSKRRRSPASTRSSAFASSDARRARSRALLAWFLVGSQGWAPCGLVGKETSRGLEGGKMEFLWCRGVWDLGELFCFLGFCWFGHFFKILFKESWLCSRFFGIFSLHSFMSRCWVTQLTPTSRLVFSFGSAYDFPISVSTWLRKCTDLHSWGPPQLHWWPSCLRKRLRIEHCPEQLQLGATGWKLKRWLGKVRSQDYSEEVMTFTFVFGFLWLIAAFSTFREGLSTQHKVL